MKASYTPELADEIVEWLSEGKPLREYCRQPWKPGKSTVGDWRKAHPDFDARFLEARDEGFDAIASECLEIADDSASDYRESKDGPVFDSEHVQRSKLRVETRLKLLAKWDPRRYGERLQLANDPENPIAGLTDEQIDARIRALQESGND